jgi:hypothetical protein
MVHAAGFPGASLPATTVVVPERGHLSSAEAANPDRQQSLRQAQQAQHGGLSEEARAIVRRLQARDSQVRQHELAHLTAAGALVTSGPSYVYERGPDGISYAVGGEVSIDTSPGRTPQETIERARTIIAAALAPADPSGADRAIALQAEVMQTQAEAELQRQSIDVQRGAANGGSRAVQAYQAVGGAASPDRRIDAYA